MEDTKLPYIRSSYTYSQEEGAGHEDIDIGSERDISGGVGVDSCFVALIPYSEAEPRLRNTLLYTNMTAQAVYDALVEKGWSTDELPMVHVGD